MMSNPTLRPIGALPDSNAATNDEKPHVGFAAKLRSHKIIYSPVAVSYAPIA